jgi:hypothetical protein
MRQDFENKMKLAQTILSKLKACQKLAGGKAEGRRPRSASHYVSTLKGLQNHRARISRTLSGCKNLLNAIRGYRCAQPPANFWQPFRLLQTAHVRRANLTGEEIIFSD